MEYRPSNNKCRVIFLCISVHDLTTDRVQLGGTRVSVAWYIMTKCIGGCLHWGKHLQKKYNYMKYKEIYIYLVNINELCVLVE